MKTIEVTGCEEKRSCCNPRTFIYSVGVVSALGVMALLVWIMWQFTHPLDKARQARGVERSKALTDLRAADTDSLKTYGWVNKDVGVTRLPVDKAMELSLQLYQTPGGRTNLLGRVSKANPAPAALE